MLFIVVADIEVVADAVGAEWPVVVVVCVIEDDVDAAVAWKEEVRPCDVDGEDEVDNKDGRSAKGGGLSRSRFPIETAVAFADDNDRER